MFDPWVRNSIQDLIYAIFVPNIIDSLHYVNRSLKEIHISALKTRLQRDPTDNEIKGMLSFEESFSILLGSMLSSDIPDIFHFSFFVKKMSPFETLSSELEFTATNIVALLDHIITL